MTRFFQELSGPDAPHAESRGAAERTTIPHVERRTMPLPTQERDPTIQKYGIKVYWCHRPWRGGLFDWTAPRATDQPASDPRTCSCLEPSVTDADQRWCPAVVQRSTKVT